ncbi:hypothetical protein CWATWH0401_953 [Crocosphaera watsonii WH 0401]|uniref:Restriction endonuclease domain-containing protein n=1 Tax=Crocosphaera watsonii WH 0401 TaxID=555881 RepID=T2JF91_CROWT|nr:hypothetical protein CWATWH0401_953 [Crocosphaera watsonii WH 0401]
MNCVGCRMQHPVKLGWLIDGKSHQIYIYPSQIEVKCLKNPITVSDRPILSGFQLQMNTIW